MQFRFASGAHFLGSALLVGAVLIAVTSGCGGGSGTSTPTTPTPPSQTSQTPRITIRFLPTAPLGWAATLQGVTVTTSGDRTFDLPAGQHTISGTTTVDSGGFGGALVISFQFGHANGGVLVGSVRGAGQTWDGGGGPCDVGFSGRGTSGVRGAVPFTVTFTVTNVDNVSAGYNNSYGYYVLDDNGVKRIAPDGTVGKR